MATKSKVLLINSIEGPAGLSFTELEPAQPGPGEVRIRVAAFALNRADLMAMSDTHYFVAQLPSRLGWEACGVVDAVGPGVQGVSIGDRVTAIPGTDFDHGTAGEFAIVLARFLMAWPKSFTAVEATSLCMQAFTGYFPIVELARTGPGDAVFITAGSSSAAIAAIQLARLQGAMVIAQTRSGEKADFIKRVGAHHVIASDHENIEQRLQDITEGGGVRVVYDCYGGDFVQKYIGALAPRAQIFIYGGMGGMQVQFPTLALVRPGATLTGYSLINYVRTDEELDRAKDFVGRAVENGHLRPVIDRVFSFDETIDAYRYMQSGAQKGKIVVVVDSNLGGDSPPSVT
jgi:NADPH:quinone reductase-like Zn-dependent oxidoreductase